MLRFQSQEEKGSDSDLSSSPPCNSLSIPASRAPSMRNGGGWGILGIGVAKFDVDIGQTMEAFLPYDHTFELHTECKKIISYLALPHTLSYTEGDSQFMFRYRSDTSTDLSASSVDQEFHYGFTLFRQRKDTSQTRGFYQKAVVLLATTPFVTVFEVAMRVIGPLIFQVGISTLEPIIMNIRSWPAPIPNTTMDLSLTGHLISCRIPPFHTILPDDRYTSSARLADLTLTEEENDHRHTTSVTLSPQPCQNLFPVHVDGPYQNVGLSSSFDLLNERLWDLWQLIITGESILVFGGDAAQCSQAVNALVSLIHPLEFRGDYRPYFTIYENDFKTISQWNKDLIYGLASIPTTILGSTNPFFVQALSRWPNYVVLSSAECTENGTKHRRRSRRSRRRHQFKEIRRDESIDDSILENGPLLVSRRSSLVCCDSLVIQKLQDVEECFSRSQSVIEEVGDEQEDNAIARRKDAILRQYFGQLTRSFLKPFARFFGTYVEKDSISAHPYASPESLLKPFNEKDFLSELEREGVAEPICQWKWKELYRRFITSSHFKHWFEAKRNKCVADIEEMLKLIRFNIQAESLVRASNGKLLGLSSCVELYHQIEGAISRERQKLQKHSSPMINVMQSHLQQVSKRIPGRIT